MLTKWLWMTFQLLSPTSREILLSLTAFRKKRSTWHSSCHSSLVVHTPAYLPFCHFPNASSLRGLHVHVAVFLPFSSPLRYRFLREDSVGLVSVSLTSLLFSTALSALGLFLCLSSISLWNLRSYENWAYILTCSTLYPLSKLFL